MTSPAPMIERSSATRETIAWSDSGALLAPMRLVVDSEEAGRQFTGAVPAGINEVADKVADFRSGDPETQQGGLRLPTCGELTVIRACRPAAEGRHRPSRFGAGTQAEQDMRRSFVRGKTHEHIVAQCVEGAGIAGHPRTGLHRRHARRSRLPPDLVLGDAPRRDDPGAALRHEADQALWRASPDLDLVLGRRVGRGLRAAAAALVPRPGVLDRGAHCRRRRADARLHVRRRALVERPPAGTYGPAFRHRLPVERRMGHRLGALPRAVRAAARQGRLAQSAGCRLDTLHGVPIEVHGYRRAYRLPLTLTATA